MTGKLVWQFHTVPHPGSTLTAYDLNTGTIKWQIPAGGDEPRAIAEGGSNTGYPMARTGIITTAAGLLFHAGLDSKLRRTTWKRGACGGPVARTR